MVPDVFHRVRLVRHKTFEPLNLGPERGDFVGEFNGFCSRRRRAGLSGGLSQEQERCGSGKAGDQQQRQTRANGDSVRAAEGRRNWTT